MEARFDIRHGQVYDTWRNIYVPIGDLYSIANALQEKVNKFESAEQFREHVAHNDNRRKILGLI